MDSIIKIDVCDLIVYYFRTFHNSNKLYIKDLNKIISQIHKINNNCYIQSSTEAINYLMESSYYSQYFHKDDNCIQLIKKLQSIPCNDLFDYGIDLKKIIREIELKKLLNDRKN